MKTPIVASDLCRHYLLKSHKIDALLNQIILVTNVHDLDLILYELLIMKVAWSFKIPYQQKMISQMVNNGEFHFVYMG